MLRCVLHVFLSISGASAADFAIIENAAVSGARFPMIGLGTFGSFSGADCWSDDCDNGAVAEGAMLNWLELGGRRIDDSGSYRHQKATGRVFQKTSIPRNEIYYVSHIGPSDPLGYEDTLAQADSIRTVVGLEYVDMLLVHWPAAGRYGTIAASSSPSLDPLCNLELSTYDDKGCRLSSWRAMVYLFMTGYARAIGVCNYNATHLSEIVEAGLPLPALNQFVYNPHRYTSHASMEQLSRSLGIIINGHSTLGGGHSWPPLVGSSSLLQEPAVVAVAAKYNATAAQVLIAWSLSLGIPVNPRTSNPVHMQQNLEAALLQLTPADMLSIGSLKEDTCDLDPFWYECAPTANICPPQCCDKPPCATDVEGNCCPNGGQFLL